MSDDARRSVGVRVRPNSHDFVRQLRADLATKQVTYWVDVRAKTTKATGDVRRWAATDLKSVVPFLNIRANTGPASRDLAEWRRRQEGIKTTISVKADTSQAIRQIEALRTMARDITVKVRADTSHAERGSGRSRMKGASGSDTLDLRADDRRNKRIAKGLGEYVRAQDIGGSLSKEIAGALDKSLKAKKAKIDVDTTPARASMHELLARFSSEKVEIDAEVDLDTTKAVGRSAELKRNVELRNVKLQADIDLRKVRTELAEFRLKEKLNKVEMDLRVKKGATEGIFKTISGLENRLGNLTVLRSLDVGPLTLGKPTGLIGTLATITALAGAVPGATAGLAALSDAMVRLGGAAALLPGLIGAIGATMATITIGTSGVSDAFSAMFDTWTEGASAQQSSAAGLVGAQNSYRNAVVDETKAQKDVAKARHDALDNLRDLNTELRGGVLNEAQALLDVQKARDRYAQGGFDNETDRLQSLLDIKKAEQSLTETREGNRRTQDKANKAAAEGVDGSDAVTDALEAQTRAAQATAQAASALATAQGGGTTAAGKFNEALQQLSPNARDFIETVAGMKDEMYGFRNAIQDTIFKGAGPAFKDMFTSILPVIEPGMDQIAAALNKNLLQVFDSVKSPDGKSIIDRILGGTSDTLQALVPVINPLIKGLGTLVAAGTEHLPQLVNLFGSLADRFANFITEADKSGSLDKFLDKGVGALADLSETALNVLKIINDMSKAFGGDLFKSLSEMTAKWHEYLSSAEGQAKINELIGKAKQIWADWKPIIEKIPAVIDSVSDAARSLIDTFGPFIEKLVDFMKNNPALVKGFITGWLGAKVLTGVFGPIITLLTTSTKLAKGLFGLLNKIPGVAGGLTKLLQAGKGVLPGGSNILTTPGTTAPLAGAGAGPARLALGAAGAFALPLAVAGGAGLAMTSQIPQDYSVNKDDSDAFVKQANDRVPQGYPKIGSRESEDFITGLAAQGTPVGKWLDDTAAGGGGVVERAKRYLWLVTQPDPSALLQDPNFVPPVAGSYMSGGHHTGYTPWGAKQGKLAELHGGEYVEPKHVVDHYGLDAMTAIHQKRVPKAALKSFEVGGPNMVWDPTTGQFVDGGTGGTSVSHGTNPANSGPGILNTVTSGAMGIAGAFANEATSVAPTGPSTGMGAGPLPGPPPGTAPDAPTGAAASPFASSFLGALGLPGFNNTGTGTGASPGWPGGKPPIGLGGGPAGPNGEAPFDMRKYGFGPGPVGSTPADWASFTGKTLGKFGADFITTLSGGLLGAVGLSGIGENLTNLSPLAAHFLGKDDKAQGAGAGQTNADVSGLLGTYDAMGGNPDYPGYGNLLGPFDPSTGSAVDPKAPGNGGLQINTLRGKQIIASKFPWATNIGGVRADSLKWHPMGLALDVMIPGAGGLNDPTPPAGKAEGDQLYAWLMANKDALGIDYVMWQQKDHFNHLHVNFAASGYPDGSGPAPLVTTTDPGSVPSAGNGGTGSDGTGGGWGGKGWVRPGVGVGSSKLGTGIKTSPFDPNPIPVLTRDRGGPLPVGTSIVHNFTGQPEMVLNKSQQNYVGSFLPGGYIPQGVVLPPPRPPDIIKMTPQPQPPPVAQPKPLAPIVPSPAPSGGGNFDPVSPGAVTPGSPPPPAQQQVPGAIYPPLGPLTVPTAPSDRPAPKVGDTGDHVHPALRKGITSGFATAGSLASMAINAAAAAGTFGAAGAAGGAGGGGLGSMVQGLFTQAGKIANNVANVASSFLVGNITGGTTSNPYGVTQRGSAPTGGSKMIDASNNQYGDIYTQDLDSYFARVDRRDAQRAQSSLGRWGNE